MDLRKEIETLAIWYIPAFICTTLASSFFSGYFQSMIEGGYETTTIGTQITFLSMSVTAMNLVDNLVVGIWLFGLSKRENGRRILWLLFGLVAHLFAAVIYIALRIFEQQQKEENLSE